MMDVVGKFSEKEVIIYVQDRIVRSFWRRYVMEFKQKSRNNLYNNQKSSGSAKSECQSDIKSR